METKLLTPKYLTKEICKTAVKVALDAVLVTDSVLFMKVRQSHCHVVILVPGMETDGRTYPDYLIHPVLMYEEWVGEKCKYGEIAQCKALQLWHDRNDEKAGIIPHLLFSGDTLYWGGVKRHGIVVTCSGVQPFYDQLIAGIVADTIKALCRSAFEASGDSAGDFV